MSAEQSSGERLILELACPKPSPVWAAFARYSTVCERAECGRNVLESTAPIRHNCGARREILLRRPAKPGYNTVTDSDNIDMTECNSVRICGASALVAGKFSSANGKPGALLRGFLSRCLNSAFMKPARVAPRQTEQLCVPVRAEQARALCCALRPTPKYLPVRCSS